MLQDVERFERQRKALLMLELVLQGDQEVRRGEDIADAEVDRQVRARLEALRAASSKSS